MLVLQAIGVVNLQEPSQPGNQWENETMRRLVIGILTASFLAAACGSSGGGSAEDDFLDKVDSVCHTASTAIKQLDPTDTASIKKYSAALSTVIDGLTPLKAPTSLSDSFDAMTAAVDAVVAQAGKLSKALDSGDATAIAAASTKLTKLQADETTAADTLDALKCKNLEPSDNFATPTVPTAPTDTSATVPDTSPTVPSTPPTDATVPTTTGVSGVRLPEDLASQATAPPGFQWVPFEQVDASGLWAKPTLGPLVQHYAGGRIKNIADGFTASIWVLQTSSDITGAALDDYLTWEGTKDGKDVSTPGGRQVRQKLLAFSQTDCVSWPVKNVGISVCTFTGIDGLSVLDAFVNAQAS